MTTTRDKIDFSPLPVSLPSSFLSLVPISLSRSRFSLGALIFIHTRYVESVLSGGSDNNIYGIMKVADRYGNALANNNDGSIQQQQQQQSGQPGGGNGGGGPVDGMAHVPGDGIKRIYAGRSSCFHLCFRMSLLAIASISHSFHCYYALSCRRAAVFISRVSRVLPLN